jgi:hypothetical protein
MPSAPTGSTASTGLTWDRALWRDAQRVLERSAERYIQLLRGEVAIRSETPTSPLMRQCNQFERWTVMPRLCKESENQQAMLNWETASTQGLLTRNQAVNVVAKVGDHKLHIPARPAGNDPRRGIGARVLGAAMKFVVTAPDRYGGGPPGLVPSSAP